MLTTKVSGTQLLYLGGSISGPPPVEPANRGADGGLAPPSRPLFNSFASCASSSSSSSSPSPLKASWQDGADWTSVPSCIKSNERRRGCRSEAAGGAVGTCHCLLIITPGLLGVDADGLGHLGVGLLQLPTRGFR